MQHIISLRTRVRILIRIPYVQLLARGWVGNMHDMTLGQPGRSLLRVLLLALHALVLQLLGFRLGCLLRVHEQCQLRRDGRYWVLARVGLRNLVGHVDVVKSMKAYYTSVRGHNVGTTEEDGGHR